MIVHSKIIPGDFLFGLKNDATNNILHHQRSPSPHPLTTPNHYSPHTYHHESFQPHFLHNGSHHLLMPHYSQQNIFNHSPPHKESRVEEVLDLSRRCDSAESHRKTPSPYNTTSSFCSNSPKTNNSESPISSVENNNIFSRPVRTKVSSIGGLPSPFVASLPQQQSSSIYPNLIKTEKPSSPPPASRYHTQPEDQFSSLLHQTRLPLATATNFNNSTHNNIEQRHSSLIATPTSSSISPSLAPVVAVSSETSKSMRPFKAYPRDPLVIAANFAANDILLENRRLQRYTEFRKKALEDIRNSNGGHRTVTNPKMRRTSSRSRSPNNSENGDRSEFSDCDNNRNKLNDGNNNISSGSGKEDDGGNQSINQIRDAAYYERRRKNNAAAKKSRDRRRIKEDEIAIRAAYLERQNIELLCQIDALKAQLAAFVKSQ